MAKRRFRILADARQIVRSVGISALAIALAVYAMVLQEQKLSAVVLGAIILLVAASALIQVSRAVGRMHRREEEVRRAAREAEEHYFQVLRRILASIEAGQPYTRGRSKRVGALARRVAEQMGLGAETCRLIDMAGQVQDIGMLAVPEHIVNKRGRLGQAEHRAVSKHAEQSYQILQPLGFLSEVLSGIRHHHERMNGTGYPLGLAGDAIPRSARVLAVADAFDAMTHDRPHRPALSTLDVLEELRRCSPAGYDPACVAALEEVMNLGHLKEAHAVTSARKDLIVTAGV